MYKNSMFLAPTNTYDIRIIKGKLKIAALDGTVQNQTSSNKHILV